MKKILFIICSGLLAFSGFAQQAGLGIVVGIPRNEFRLATEAEGYGLNLTVMFPAGSEVINFGGNINYMIYGLNAQNKDLFVGINGLPSFNIPLRVINTNSIFGMHAIMRITAPTENVRPYFEGLFGFRYISTTTRIEDRQDFWGDEEDVVLVRRTNLDDFVLSFGGGGGLQFNIGDDSYLDFRAYYLLGSKAKFYDGSDTKHWEIDFSGDPSTFDINNPNADEFSFGATPRKSTTDMLMVQIGATFKF
ncbi:MAG: hypothetical protein GY816_21525 [Cytophagales bacterium]|nr:hypothetical protein [Cytophagales bacterium]